MYKSLLLPVVSISWGVVVTSLKSYVDVPIAPAEL